MTDKGKGSIRILHLSDLHVKEDTNDLRREIQALENDLKENYDAVDYIVITGDLTFSGKKEQFDVIATRLIPRLKAIAKVNPRNIIVVPGNHDIDRDLVPSIQKSGIKSLVEMKDADAFVSDIISSAGFDAYRGFIKGLQLMKAAETDEVFCRYTSSMAREFSGKIYFACLNTAWTCIDDRNKGEICLSKKQLEYGSSMGSDVNIRIAVMHHGLDWLHEMDVPLVTRIQNSFDLVITGHVHRDSSVVQITPQTQIVILTGTCFCGDDSAKYHGYNVTLIPLF